MATVLPLPVGSPAGGGVAVRAAGGGPGSGLERPLHPPALRDDGAGGRPSHGIARSGACALKGYSVTHSSSRLISACEGVLTLGIDF